MSNSKFLIMINFLISILFICMIIRAKCDEYPDIGETEVYQQPPCAACSILINSFKRAMEKTKIDGGDTTWEEDNLESYATSETMFIEIQERLCIDVDTAEAQCKALAEEFQQYLEDWWFHHQKHHPDMFDYICVRQVQRCCPKDHYGPLCAPCIGYPDKVCSNNGRCKGAGTRKGNGSCLCNKGYNGTNCSECAVGYYHSYKDENKFLCSSCHYSCDGPCKGAGPENCEKCARGWNMVDGKGCIDIDECVKITDFCLENQFCINKEGTYTCLNCDLACNGCTGDGPDMCIECAEGYQKKDNLCMNSDILDRKWQENFTRYAIYVGLCLAICIIFQRSIYIASIIGLMVAVYISVSEYMIAYSDVQDTTANVNILGPA